MNERVTIDRTPVISANRAMTQVTREAIRSWLTSQLPTEFDEGHNHERLRLAIAAELDLKGAGADTLRTRMDVLSHCATPRELVAVTNVVLRQSAERDAIGLRLEQLLGSGSDDWKVATDRRSLEPRTSEASDLQSQRALRPADEAARHLSEAWRCVHGTLTDASDAWDHCIKSLEAVLIPIVVPAKSRPTLGDVLGQLRTTPGKWKFVLTRQDGSGGTETVEAILRLIWPNPDRHSDPAGSTRAPTVAEAKAVLNLSIALVEVIRDGALRSEPRN